MNISSVIVHAKPTEIPSVRGNLEQIPGVEIHAATDDGKFVITIETETDGETASTGRPHQCDGRGDVGRHGFPSIRIRSSEGGLK